jgi:hypothetical protein
MDILQISTMDQINIELEKQREERYDEEYIYEPAADV